MKNSENMHGQQKEALDHVLQHYHISYEWATRQIMRTINDYLKNKITIFGTSDNQEYESLEQKATGLDRRIHDNPGNGHCGPLAILKCLYHESRESRAVYQRHFGNHRPDGTTAVNMLRRMVQTELHRDAHRYFPFLRDNNQHWNSFLEDTGGDGWFNHITLQAAANALNVRISVVESKEGWPNTRIESESKTSAASIYLGHVGTYHFVSLLERRSKKKRKPPQSPGGDSNTDHNTRKKPKTRGSQYQQRSL